MKWTEIVSLNEGLKTMDLDQPSMSFERNFWEKIKGGIDVRTMEFPELFPKSFRVAFGLFFSIILGVGIWAIAHPSIQGEISYKSQEKALDFVELWSSGLAVYLQQYADWLLIFAFIPLIFLVFERLFIRKTL